jgi:hypothetical protein
MFVLTIPQEEEEEEEVAVPPPPTPLAFQLTIEPGRPAVVAVRTI